MDTEPKDHNEKFYFSVSPFPLQLDSETVAAVRAIEKKWSQPVFMLSQHGQSPSGLKEFGVALLQEIQKVAKQLPEHPLIILQSQGGDGDAAYRLARIFQQTCNGYDVLIPDSAKSAATIFCLGATKIFMGPTAECGPIDPIIRDGESKNFPALVQIRAKEILEEIFGAVNANIIQVGTSCGLTENSLKRILRAPSEGAAPHLDHFASKVAYAEQGVKEVQENAMHLLTERGISRRVSKQIVQRLTFNYFNHNHPINNDELRALGLKHVHPLDREEQQLVNRLMEVLPPFPCIGTLKHWQMSAVHHGREGHVLDVHSVGPSAPSRDGGGGTTTSSSLEEEDAQ